MKKITLFTFLIGVMIVGLQTTNAQRILTYDEFIKNVREKNIEYIVEKYEVSIAEANAQAAKVMPDPSLSFSYDDSDDGPPQDRLYGKILSVELGYTLELGGKRRARISIARSEQQMTEALVEDFFRNLRADATLCYLETLKQKHFAGLALSSWQSMRDLARGDSLRYALGEIAQVDAMQSRLEATTLMTEYFQAEVDYKNILSDLAVFEGGTAAIDSLSGALSLINRTYQLQNLIELAQDNRADLRAAIRNRELSAANLRLAKADRVIDLDLNIAFAHNTQAMTEVSPTVPFNTYTAGVAIPLKFSNFNRGRLRAAQFAEQQADAMYEAVLLQIRNEVIQRYNSYESARRQADLFQNGALADATSILEMKRYSYTRGETSLFEVLNAQRTANDVFQNYYKALYDINASLVELCRATGIWDVDF